jgi:spore coat protein U-like protein
MFRPARLLVSLSLFAVAAAYGADDLTDTITFNVKLEITESCEFTTASDVDFDSTARSTDTEVLTSTGSLIVNCTGGTPYSIGLNDGANGGRRMTDGNGNYIAYELYQDDAYGIVWGNSMPNEKVAGTGNAADQTLTVYGQVDSILNVPRGEYSDSVVATVTY